MKKVIILTILLFFNSPCFTTDNYQSLIIELEDSLNLHSKVILSEKQRLIYDPYHPLSIKDGAYRGYIILNHADRKKLFKRLKSFLMTKHCEITEKDAILKIVVKYKQFYWKKILINRKNVLMHNTQYYNLNQVYKKKYAYIHRGQLFIRDTLSKHYYTIDFSAKETIYYSHINLIHEIVDFIDNCNIYNYLNEVECVIRAHKPQNKLNIEKLNSILESYINKNTHDYINNKDFWNSLTKKIQNYFRDLI